MSINAHRIVPAEYKRTIHMVTPEAGTKIEAMLDPTYWRHVARLLKPLDRLEVMPEDGAWYAELMVIFTAQNEVKVKQLSFIELDAVDVDAIVTDTHEVKWRGPSAKFGVVNTKTGEVLKDGFADKQLAASYMAEHLKALAA